MLKISVRGFFMADNTACLTVKLRTFYSWTKPNNQLLCSMSHKKKWESALLRRSILLSPFLRKESWAAEHGCEVPKAPYLEGCRSAEEDLPSLEVRNKYKKANLSLLGWWHMQSPVYRRSVSRPLQTLTQLHRPCWERLRQPGPCPHWGTGRGTSSCTVSWSMKLQHFSCSAGAAATKARACSPFNEAV